MIQRIQSLWLFLAAMIMLSLFYFSIYKFRDDGQIISIGNDYLGIILLVGSVILSLVAIFNFKKRKTQISMIWLNILVCVGLQVWLFFEINQLKPENINDAGYFGVGAFIPLIVIVLLFLAKMGITKDEKLVKSLNRLR